MRVAHGDVVDVQATLLVVTHLNDMRASGAEAAVDRLLGGAISRHVGPRRAALGVTYLLPAINTPLAVACVAVVSLGDGEQLHAGRLGEIGVAIVEAAATIAAPDVATVVHGAGSLGVDFRQAAKALMSGVLSGIRRVPQGGGLRALTLVERDEANLERIRTGVAEAPGDVGVHVFIEELEVRRTVAAATGSAGGLPQQLRLGITRADDQLKVTTIGDEAFDVAREVPFPEDVAATVADGVRDVVDVHRRRSARRREEALRSLGTRLYRGFLDDPSIDVPARVEACGDGYVVLRLDDWTVDLPWELTVVGDSHLMLDYRVARQVELRTPARQAAYAPENEKLTVLVIGDPTGDLPAARTEAERVAAALEQRAGAEVELLVAPVAYADVSRALDEQGFDVLHYAGHARFDALHEDASGLVLADRLLTAQDLGSRRYVPRLVVANGCHSGATGDARLAELKEASLATRDLVASVLQAGARGFVGAAWEVDDKAAATFAGALYDELLVDEPAPRATLGEAVRRARVAVVQKHGLHQPAWAAYVLYGSPWQRAW